MREAPDSSPRPQDDLQTMYRSSSESVRSTRRDAAGARGELGGYVDFVCGSVPARGALLDVGCGDGWSARLLADRGFDVTGLDLNTQAFTAPAGSGLSLREGSVLDLPFEDASFDVVCSNQMLEHVPDPRRALLEMLRVLRVGGTLCVVGPNLVSVGIALKALGFWVWQNRPVGTIFRRQPDMARHPFGNTLPEAARALVGSAALTVSKLAGHEVTFTMRAPDLRPPFHGDNDACYLCNPIDLIRFLRSCGCEILRNGRPGRIPGSAVLAGGTWIAARRGR